jgi:hypothetical protein
MADNDPVIAKALEQIAQHDGEAARHSSESARLKTFINEYDRLAGREPRYADVTATVGATMTANATVTHAARTRTWEAGEFFNKPLATVARTILQARYEAVGKPAPATVDEIHEAMLQGTYDFEGSSAEQQKQSIRISLGKNSPVFVKLPNTDKFGLVEWYGGRSTRRARRVADDILETPEVEPGVSDDSLGGLNEKAAA